ncbi:hypothetical protein IE81DRAFT_368446 [Ceraceosorus guamensis]|uniref:YWTD domain-containing protein n=1 Tax=Ceraceosorus guamensis TaxID=1522189 RepID=A0A316VVB2_9BASI|nr:hypothetical protein IE81DRAFT_368446 [Ceraceosorus guamensis]PWN40241.1 hypothetical protein IE81DRAFT_368446 [Ceraceosorus guamensis]
MATLPRLAPLSLPAPAPVPSTPTITILGSSSWAQDAALFWLAFGANVNLICDRDEECRMSEEQEQAKSSQIQLGLLDRLAMVPRYRARNTLLTLPFAEHVGLTHDSAASASASASASTSTSTSTSALLLDLSASSPSASQAKAIMLPVPVPVPVPVPAPAPAPAQSDEESRESTNEQAQAFPMLLHLLPTRDNDILDSAALEILLPASADGPSADLYSNSSLTALDSLTAALGLTTWRRVMDAQSPLERLRAAVRDFRFACSRAPSSIEEAHPEQVPDGLDLYKMLQIRSGQERQLLDAQRVSRGLRQMPTPYLLALELLRAKLLCIDAHTGQTHEVCDLSSFGPSGSLRGPDGVTFDASRGCAYVTCMGTPSSDNGWILRVPLSVRHGPEGERVGASKARHVSCSAQPEYVVRPGQTHTPKQVYYEEKTDRIYWCDREGGRIQSIKPDGSSLQTIYRSQPAHIPKPLVDQRDWCVGIAIDAQRELLYWTQKGYAKSMSGRIFCAPLPTIASQSQEEEEASHLTPDSESVHTIADALPEPIDLHLSPDGQWLYCTTRGEVPFGNSVLRFWVGRCDKEGRGQKPSAAQAAASQVQRLTPASFAPLLVSLGFHEAIGLAISSTPHHPDARIYVADLGGSIWSHRTNGTDRRCLLKDAGSFTGLCLLE